MPKNQSKIDANSVSAPSQYPTPDELVARARALVSQLIAEQAQTEERSFYSEHMHEAFKEAGFYRMLVPKRFGGYEMDLKSFYRVMTVIASGCPSTSWQLCFGASQAKIVGTLFSPETQARIFGDGHFISPFRPLPTGFAEQTEDGGWKVNATFQYCSGSPYATHCMGLTLHKRPDGEVAPLLVVIPRSEWTRLDDWRGSMGLKGSGSHSIQVTDGYVPRDFVIADKDALELFRPPEFDPSGAQAKGGAPLYYGHIVSFISLQPAALSLGMVKGALELYGEYMRTKKTFNPPVTMRSENWDYRQWYGSALAKVAMAEAALLQMCDQWTEAARRHRDGVEEFSNLESTRISAMSFEIAEMNWNVMQQYCFRTSGTSTVFDGQRMQRIFRDMCTVRTHGFNTRVDATIRELADLSLEGGSDQRNSA